MANSKLKDKAFRPDKKNSNAGVAVPRSGKNSKAPPGNGSQNASPPNKGGLNVLSKVSKNGAFTSNK